MPVTLYKRQRQILDFISQYIQKFGVSPTLQQIADAIGVSSLATIHEHLSNLEEKGVLRRYKGKIRAIEILDESFLTDGGGPQVEVPILGFIAAGAPIEAYTDPEASLFIPTNLISGKKRSFVLQVKGESMIDEGILDGDFVVVEEQVRANNGDIVVAVLEDGLATLKRYFKEKTRIRLEPANSSMKPIFAKNVAIKGRVTGVIRKFGN
ncbi:MAG: transcriptional repressor LexA [Candidatus Shapirobacteria bacterium]|nr:transcriptional repressor LexA [Candidatus Shapirobacteria bacterium]